MSSERRTVWILGSGFSQPLGGPVLNDLIAPGVDEDLVSQGFQDGNGRKAFKFIARLFNAGRPHANRDPTMVTNNKDAERTRVLNGERVENTSSAAYKNRTYSLKVHPLFSQDFIALWEPQLTYRPCST
jgi:hypothetical protein